MATYNVALDAMLQRIWLTVEWRRHQLRGKKQCRLYPEYRKDNAFK